jgi:hypothetical protein
VEGKSNPIQSFCCSLRYALLSLWPMMQFSNLQKKRESSIIVNRKKFENSAVPPRVPTHARATSWSNLASHGHPPTYVKGRTIRFLKSAGSSMVSLTLRAASLAEKSGPKIQLLGSYDESDTTAAGASRNQKSVRRMNCPIDPASRVDGTGLTSRE